MEDKSNPWGWVITGGIVLVAYIGDRIARVIKGKGK